MSADGISFRGILVGILVHFLANFVLGFGLAMALGSGDLSNWNLILYANMAVAVAISVSAGYAAAYVAGRGERINGALSVFLAAIVGLLISRALAPAGDYEVQHVIALVAPAPLFGLLGGYLRRWQRLRARRG